MWDVESHALGELRVVRRFAWLPQWGIDGKRHWLELYWTAQHWMREYGWCNVGADQYHDPFYRQRVMYCMRRMLDANTPTPTKEGLNGKG